MRNVVAAVALALILLFGTALGRATAPVQVRDVEVPVDGVAPPTTIGDAPGPVEVAHVASHEQVEVRGTAQDVCARAIGTREGGPAGVVAEATFGSARWVVCQEPGRDDRDVIALRSDDGRRWSLTRLPALATSPAGVVQAGARDADAAWISASDASYDRDGHSDHVHAWTIDGGATWAIVTQGDLPPGVAPRTQLVTGAPCGTDADQLLVAAGPDYGGMRQFELVLVFVNTTAVACRLDGHPTVQVVDYSDESHSRQVAAAPEPVAAGTAPASVVLQPGGAAFASLHHDTGCIDADPDLDRPDQLEIVGDALKVSIGDASVNGGDPLTASLTVCGGLTISQFEAVPSGP